MNMAPMDNNKIIGKNWGYFSAGAVVLGDVLNKSVPSGLNIYANQKLFKPLEITNFKWQFTPTNVPNTAGGFQMSALDNARWGQLYIDNGVFEKQQLLPENWVKDSLTKQVGLPELDNEFYGYLLWNKQFKFKGKAIEAYYASGNGGNKIMIINELNTVIVLTATAFNQPYSHHQANEIISEYILPSLEK